jgi:hypothetical protein
MRLTVLVACLPFIGVPTTVSELRLLAATISEVSGPVSLKSPRGTAPERLKSMDRGRKIFAGDKVFVGSSGTLVLQHRNGTKERFASSTRWKLVHRRYSAEEMRLRAEIDRLAEAAAKPRDGLLIYPAGKPVPAHFFFLLLNNPASGTHEVVIRNDLGEVISRQRFANGLPKLVRIKGASEALAAMRHEGIFEMEVVGGGHVHRVRFGLMSLEQERALHGALMLAEEEQDIEIRRWKRDAALLRAGVPIVR